jgi:DNA-binding MarR family transcriptional regulator
MVIAGGIMTKTIRKTQRDVGLAETMSDGIDSATARIVEQLERQEFDADRLEARKDELLPLVVRGVERHDYGFLAQVAAKLGQLARLVGWRAKGNPAAEHFAGYLSALSDVSRLLARDVDVTLLPTLVSRSKHLVPALHVLYANDGLLPHGAVAGRLDITPSSLTRTMNLARHHGLVTEIPSGRNKYYRLTRSGERFLAEAERPMLAYFSRRLIDEFWMLSLRRSSFDDGIDMVVDACPSLFAEPMRMLLSATRDVELAHADILSLSLDLKRKRGHSFRIVIPASSRVGERLGLCQDALTEQVVLEETAVDRCFFRPADCTGSRNAERLEVYFIEIKERDVELRDARSNNLVAFPEIRDPSKVEGVLERATAEFGEEAVMGCLRRDVSMMAAQA